MYPIIHCKDAHKGKTALVLGGGPSLLEINKEDFKDDIKIVCNSFYRTSEDVSNSKAELLGMIKIPFFSNNFKPDYWCCACNFKTMTGHPDFGGDPVLDKAIEFDADLFMTCHIAADYPKIMDYLEGKKKDAVLWDWNRMDFQQEFARHFGTEETYSHGTSVIIHQIALAMYLGCSSVYVTGMDLSYTRSKEKYGSTHAGFDIDTLIKEDALLVPSTISLIKQDLTYFGKIAHSRGIKLYNMSYETNQLKILGWINSKEKEDVT